MMGLVSGIIGLLVIVFFSWIVFGTIRRMRAQDETRRLLLAHGLQPRKIYAESLIHMRNQLAAFGSGPANRKEALNGQAGDDPFAALFCFVNKSTLADFDGASLEDFLRNHLKPLTPMQLRRIELFVASAELPDRDFAKLRRKLIGEARVSAENIRSEWRASLSALLDEQQAATQELDESRRQKKLWAEQRRSPVPDAELTAWLRAQGPEMWHELCLRAEWSERGAAALVPFVMWVAGRSELDRGSALVLIAKAVCDAIDTEPYDQHDCARNRAWMKSLHAGLVNDVFAPSRFEIPRFAEPEVAFLFDAGKAGEWALSRDAISLSQGVAHHAGYVFIGNRPVESFEKWKARGLV